MQDLLEVQVNAVLHNEELTDDELKEMAIFLTHYVGFPLGSKLDGVVRRVAGQAQEGRGEGQRRGQEGTTSTTPCKMHVGRTLDDK